MANTWQFFLTVVSVALLLFMLIPLVSANVYIPDIYFTLPDSVFYANENIQLKGYVYFTNISDNGTYYSNNTVLVGQEINLSIWDESRTLNASYNLTTDSNGSFYSRSNFYLSSPLVSAPLVPGNYYIRASVVLNNTNNSNSTYYSEIEFSVANQTMDFIRVSSDKARYNPGNGVIVSAEAVKKVGDRILYISNVSISGNLRDSAKEVLEAFSCTTGSNGKCTTTVTAPDYGEYILEVNNFKAFSSFQVVPFSFILSVKDENGKSIKNVFSRGEKAKIEVKANNASSSDTYRFIGYIKDSSGRIIENISTVVLNSNNSFANSYEVSIDSDYNYGSYSVYVDVTKDGDGTISSLTSFKIEDWSLSLSKKSSRSGFEYGYSAFPNSTLYFELLPLYRINGSIVPNISFSSFTALLKDELNNVINSSNVSWNSSCGTSGCYEFSLRAPENYGKYSLYATLVYSNNVQTISRAINIINTVISAQSTDKNGNIKELFGTNEFVYLSFLTYNLTNPSVNLSDAELFIVQYMNGTEISYSNASSFEEVNGTGYRWSWNSSLQRIKMDTLKMGGLYNIYIFGNNRSAGAEAKFIINPYDACISPKNSLETNSYYVWQFKTSDTIYFEIKISQANNPLGKATALNLSSTSNSSTNGTQGGLGAACAMDTTTKQVVTNATLTIDEVKNSESGVIQSFNSSGSSCTPKDNLGTYICTLKPLSKWDSGQILVKVDIEGQDGSTSTVYGMFEARAFYLYGWSQSWQNSPTSNITLQIQIYEAGSNWWGSGSGISGTVTVTKVEYQGGSGEWIWPPIDSGYNVSLLNSTSVSGSTGTMTLDSSYASGGRWKTGNYRAVLKATTSSGDTDYGYAWFGIRMWDVYGSPIECTDSSCNYKSYFNTRENITLFIQVNKPGMWGSYNQDLSDNVSVSVKKIQDCRTWPCKELNQTDYSANSINVSRTSGYYWSGNLTSLSNYIIYINSTSGIWDAGSYNVILDVKGINESDSGSAWFNSIAFYVETQPVNSNGTSYKYNIKPGETAYINVTTTKNYKYSSSGTRYNFSDYVNTSIVNITLSRWDQNSQSSVKYNLQSLNVAPLQVNGTQILNITYTNGNWPSGYYWGELLMNNSDGENSRGWLYFNVQPFRVDTSISSYNVDYDSCANASLNAREPDWNYYSLLYGNYSVTGVYEDIWSMSGVQRTTYTNYTLNGGDNTTEFNATTYINICPNEGGWGSGSWGGYHYLSLIVSNASDLASNQTGWLYFRTIPFITSWNSGSNIRKTSSKTATVTLTRVLGGNASGNLTKLYQWRYDAYKNGEEEYIYKTNDSCWSNVSSACTINGAANITIFPPSYGWKSGYNYIYSVWTNVNGSTRFEDYNGIYFQARDIYYGTFSNYDQNNSYKYNFAQDENLTIKVVVRDPDDNLANVNITKVEYSTNYYTYSDATYTTTNLSYGTHLITMTNSGNWSLGYYYIRITVTGSEGSVLFSDTGNLRVKDMVAPTLNITYPINNVTYSNNSLIFNITLSENGICESTLYNYYNFYNSFCYNWNATNSSNQTKEACNTTKYNYSGNTYYYEWLSYHYHSLYSDNGSAYCYRSSSCSGSNDALIARARVFTSGTSSTSQSFTLNTTNWTEQNYGVYINCYDNDWNYGHELVTVAVNNPV